MRLSRERLYELVEEATIDAYGDAEQAAGFYTMMEDDLAMPFSTQILGVEVTVERIDMTDADEIIAVCKRGGEPRLRRRLRACPTAQHSRNQKEAPERPPQAESLPHEESAQAAKIRSSCNKKGGLPP